MIGFYIQNKNNFSDKVRYVFRQLAKMIGVQMVEINDLSKSLDRIDLLFIYGDVLPVANTSLLVVFIAQSDYSQNAALNHFDVQSIETNIDGLPKSINYLFSAEIPQLPTPVYIDSKSSELMIGRDDHRVHCAVDIVATCFYFLSLENERRATDRDHFHRFQKNYSPIGEDIYDSPVVDRYANVLRHLITSLVAGYKLQPIWPENKPFAVALSHDVDRIPTWTFTKAKRALRGENSPYKNPISRAFRLAQSVTFPENWLGNFNFISRLEQRFDAHSNFFFVSRHRHDLDPTYKLDSQIIKQGINSLQRRGCDVGVHGTIPSSTNEGFLELEKEDLEFFINKDVIGGRQHYLCFTKETTSYWKNANLKYDSTLGFSYHTGYRCGTSFPFLLHDGAQELPIYEIPLVLMDTVLFLESKQFLSAAGAWKVIEQHLEETKRNDGLLTINWHNSDLHPYDVYGYSQLYIKILKWAQENNGWLASTDAVYDWWAKK
jgi:hypothetical protein